MGQQAEIYERYRAKFDEAMEKYKPEFHNYVSIVGDDQPIPVSTLVHISGQSKVMSGDGRYEGTYQAPDGRIVERTLASSGMWEKWHIWPNKEAWYRYEEPLPYNVYFEF